MLGERQGYEANVSKQSFLNQQIIPDVLAWCQNIELQECANDDQYPSLHSKVFVSLMQHYTWALKLMSKMINIQE